MTTATTTSWQDLADRALAGAPLGEADALAVLQSDDNELLDLLAAAYRVRRHWFGNRVILNQLINAKSGLCGEDCGYCSQSRVSQAEVARYRLLPIPELLDGARHALQRGAATYCIVTAGRGPAARELETLTRAVTLIKAELPLKICVCPGLLNDEQAQRLASAGVDRVNHNLNTSEAFYPKICTTHTYQDRLATLRAVRAAGMEICSGGIVGMGESDADVVELALRVGQLRVESVPVNFFIPVAGAAITDQGRLNPRYCLKVLALFRFANPAGELRIAGGRELHLGPLQPLGLYAANSIFLGDYLTTKGQAAEEDHRMIEALGFEPVVV